MNSLSRRYCKRKQRLRRLKYAPERADAVVVPTRQVAPVRGPRNRTDGAGSYSQAHWCIPAYRDTVIRTHHLALQAILPQARDTVIASDSERGTCRYKSEGTQGLLPILKESVRFLPVFRIPHTYNPTARAGRDNLAICSPGNAFDWGGVPRKDRLRGVVRGPPGNRPTIQRAGCGLQLVVPRPRQRGDGGGMRLRPAGKDRARARDEKRHLVRGPRDDPLAFRGPGQGSDRGRMCKLLLHRPICPPYQQLRVVCARGEQLPIRRPAECAHGAPVSGKGQLSDCHTWDPRAVS